MEQQHPLNSKYYATTSTTEVIKGINLTGKTAIVTGGYAGIGLETVKTLVNAGAKVYVPARDIEKATRNLKGIAGVIIEKMDLMDITSIDAFAARFLSLETALHLLINNAGIMWVPLRRDNRGNESQLSTNHLGHFRLTARLWPALKNAGGARVISVSSFGHQMAPFNFEDPNFLHRDYETLQGYGQSKTANNLFAVALDARAKAFGVRAYALHPGSVNDTDLGREAPISMFQEMGTFGEDGKIKPEVAASLKTIPQGAATTIWCATSPLLNNIGGVYCEDCDVAETDNGQIIHDYADPASLTGVQPYSIDADNAEKLWLLTESLADIRFNLA
ncbi:MAG: family NAD(P)-dependent oxidoreductase [Bacteroidetes bacterium]|uniref:SDR family NAD(P)-dependent oxidoreductase n=1 Tax=unclassified Chitinophaga TaxID=2619133 RepID=UPI0009D5AB73|nr:MULTISPECIES: SDR family NAD(P)-dependent oxidoreductase [unclassified Chitinophaga]MBP1653038.1 family NAD(P)-dependent oxidoreductase [Bacteroidota bacterium]OMP77869.1 oxidoreductase [[Flexibacter] sp. ATCC 35208]WPV65882.1 SDR family NAD(P)-dependent oxidoreductase [Chitinophaga sp. LS1]